MTSTDHVPPRLWDYRVAGFHARHIDMLEQSLKEVGREGWELVFMQSPVPNKYQCVFRRPMA
ncbi:MAG TPA: hypothetical protein VLH79_10165 [Chthonomonadales bacterium]|nr:hypothetical protein [Chthonomonadales bacterium]